MHSTEKPRLTDDPHDFVVVPPDAVRVVPSDDELSHVLRDAARRLGDTQAHAEPGFDDAAIPPVDTTFRATAVDDLVAGDRWPIGDWALRGLTAFAFAACTCAAGVAWQFYGGPAKQAIAEWTPLALMSSPPAEQPQDAPPAAAPVEAAAANAETPQPAPPAPPAPTAAEAAAAAVAPVPDQAQVLQSTARDLASARAEIEQLKASIAELKASQQQMSSKLAKASEPKASEPKASEQSQRPRTSAPPPHAAAAHAHKPMPYPPRQAVVAPAYRPAAAPYMPPPPASPPQLTDPELASVPRPPMPVR